MKTYAVGSGELPKRFDNTAKETKEKKYPCCVMFSIYARYFDYGGPSSALLEKLLFCKEGYKPINPKHSFTILPADNFDDQVDKQLYAMAPGYLQKANHYESIPSLWIDSLEIPSMK